MASIDDKVEQHAQKSKDYNGGLHKVGSHGEHHVYADHAPNGNEHYTKYHVHNSKTGKTHDFVLSLNHGKKKSPEAVSKGLGSHGSEHVAKMIHGYHNDVAHDPEYEPSGPKSEYDKLHDKHLIVKESTTVKEALSKYLAEKKYQ